MWVEVLEPHVRTITFPIPRRSVSITIELSPSARPIGAIVGWVNGADLDSRVRLRAFEFLEHLRARHPHGVPRQALAAGFDFEGRRVPLVGPQGIFKPAVLPDMPLSITTVPIVEGRDRPYEDRMTADGLLEYQYRGTDPQHPDNVGLRLAMQRQVPLVYLYGLVPGVYMPEWPVYIMGDDPRTLCFTVAIDEKRAPMLVARVEDDAETNARRRYVTRSARRRLHQQSFRERVLAAYRRCCAVCRLKHEELLEAAHILPDGHPRGEPIVSNGLALCQLHHAAFDVNILGVDPDRIIHVRRDVLDEADGPMLVHGLQGFHHKEILVVPHPENLRPNRDFLAERFEQFRRAG